MSSTVVIAAPEHLSALKERSGLDSPLEFADSDALQALDLITRRCPSLVVLERLFAATSRGAALINRIKADPSLASCEIRVVSHDGSTGHARPAARRTEEAAAGGGGAALAVAAPPAPLDHRGTRRAPRFKVLEGVEVLVDGNPATLVDLSTAGAQVVSASILKPNQRVRMSLSDRARPLRFSAGVAWASFEIPQAGPRYRAGVEFVDADAEALDKFIELKKR